MHSSTSNSDRTYIPLLVFLLILSVLLISWEVIIRTHYNPPVVINYDDKASKTADALNRSRKEWLIFGNCLALNGISPKAIKSFWKANTPIQNFPSMRNISRHEQSPLAFFHYLQKAEYYPDVIITNVSSWLNSTNYLTEAQQLITDDPLTLFPKKRKSNKFGLGAQENLQSNNIQTNIEQMITSTVSQTMKQSDKRFHLLDFSIFLYNLILTGDLRNSLYHINIQSWYKMAGQDSDGHGQIAFHISYDPSWEKAQDIMVEKQLVRMRTGHFLTDGYWSKLKSFIRHFKERGTDVYLVRLPEHKDIYKFNESYYNLSDRLGLISKTTKSPVLDLNQSGIVKQIKLYDTVHPDHQGSMLISKTIASWIAEMHPMNLMSYDPISSSDTDNRTLRK